jgi:hypothetical protein
MHPLLLTPATPGMGREPATGGEGVFHASGAFDKRGIGLASIGGPEGIVAYASSVSGAS